MGGPTTISDVCDSHRSWIFGKEGFERLASHRAAGAVCHQDEMNPLICLLSKEECVVLRGISPQSRLVA
jgi:hypothetical protein